jgi:hypothetical protein
MKADRRTLACPWAALVPRMPICQGMAGSPQASQHGLLWGRSDSSASTKEEQALGFCRQLIERNVACVFFAPLELTPIGVVGERGAGAPTLDFWVK